LSSGNLTIASGKNPAVGGKIRLKFLVAERRKVELKKKIKFGGIIADIS
jgi:hypothetical protein